MRVAWSFLALALLATTARAAEAKCEGRGCTCQGVEFNTPLKKFQPAVACIYYNKKKVRAPLGPRALARAS